MTRNALLLGTALQSAAMLTLMQGARAQIAPNTRPAGGVVSAGQASIGGNAATTLITQTTQNAVINWQTYNVGSAQTVQYVQPNSSSMTLNRVLTPDPSVIAGRITANGQVAIVNQSGVLFVQGSQVDTAGLVVSAANITDQNFMAGRLIFNQAARPGATISNAGNITVRQAGLAALVAPQVANSGTITAQLGRVVLGGAVTQTLDLYGDGLVALNVTGQVTKASLGGKPVQALVTNTGTILAPGGTIVLSAAAVDGVVTNLVAAGGTISAPSVGAQAGRILVQGVGGGLIIEGTVTATGVAAGTQGGQVVADATGNVTIAAGAQVDASGDAGGGLIAIGTTASRAAHGPGTPSTMTASNVTIGAGATLRADARRSGRGGRIAVLSRGTTRHAGSISAQGPHGGWVEVSGSTLAMSGGINAGAGGTVLLDPKNIVIESSGTPPSGTTKLTPAYVDSLVGDIIIEADGTLDVLSNVALNNAATSLELRGDEGIAVDALVNAHGLPVLLYSRYGSIVENSLGAIDAGTLTASSHGSLVLGGENAFSAIAAFDNKGSNSLSGTIVTDSYSGQPRPRDTISLGNLVATGDITLDDTTQLTDDVDITTSNGSSITVSAGAFTIAGTLKAGLVTLDATSLAESGAITATTLSGSTTGNALLTASNNSIGTLGNFSSGNTFSLADVSALDIAGALKAGLVTLDAASLAESGAITATTLSGSTTGNALLTASTNSIGTLGNFSSGNTFSLADVSGLTLDGTLRAGTLQAGTYTGTAAITASTGDINETSTGTLLAGTLIGSASAGSIALDTSSGFSSGNQIAATGALNAGTSLTLVDGQALAIEGNLLASSLMLIAPTLTIGQSIDIQGGLASLVADHFAFTGAGAVSDVGGTVALDLLGATNSTIFSVGTLASDTVMVSDLGRINTANGTLALGSLDGLAESPATADGSTWGTGSGGTVSTLLLQDAPLDLTRIASALGLYSNGDIVSTAGITVASLYGSAGEESAMAMASLTGSNLIATIGVMQDGKLRGFTVGNSATPTSVTDFTLTDGEALTVLGPVTVNDGGISLDVTAGGLTFAAGGGDMTGTEVRLRAAAGITQYAGTIAAKGEGGSGQGTIALLADAGDITLAGRMQAGAGAVLLDASAGSITETATGAGIQTGRLAADAGGSITLGNLGTLSATANMIGTVTSLSNTLTGNLAGLTAAGSGGVTLVDDTNLLVADGTAVTASGKLAALTIIALDGGALTLGNSGGAAITAGGDLTLEADGAVTQNGGVTKSLAGTISVTSDDAGVVQHGGAILALDGDVDVLAASGITQLYAARISATGDATLLAAAGITQSDGSTISAGYDARLASTGGGFTQFASTVSGAHGISIDVAGDVAMSGTITASGIAGDSTSGTILIASENGGIAIGGIVEAPGRLAGDRYAAVGPSTVLLSAAGDITESDAGSTGTIMTGVLAAAAGREGSGSIALMNGSNEIGTIAALAAHLSALSLSGLDGFTLTAPVSIISSPGLAAGAAFGNVALNDAADLTVADGAGVSAPAGAINLATIGADGLASLTVGTASGATIVADGGITLTAGGAFSQSGGTIASSGSSVAVTSAGGGITETNGDIAAGGNVTLNALTDVDAAGSHISADGDATVTAGRNVTDTGSAIQAGRNASLTAAGDLMATNATLEAGGSLYAEALTGSLAASGSSFAGAGAGLYAGAGITLAASTVRATAGDADIVTGGDLTEDGRSIVSASGNATLAAAGSIVQDAGGLVTSIGTAALAAASGALDIGGTIGGPNGTLAGTVLLDGVTIEEFGGTVRASTFAAAAAGAISLASGGNQIGTLVAATIGAPMLGPQDDATPIALAGLTGTEVTLFDAIGLSEAAGARLTAVALSLSSQGAIALGNAGNAVATVETLTALDGLALTDSVALTLAAGATVAAQSGAVVLTDTADITQLGGGIISAAQGMVTLGAAGTITLAGDLRAPAIFLGGEGGGTAQAVMWNANTIETGAARGAGKPLAEGSAGLLVAADTLLQAGTTRITPLGPGGSTVQITLAGQGGARFADLEAPTTKLLFDLRAGGSVSGSVAVGALTVFYDAGNLPPDVTKLIGTVDGKPGVAAASVSTALEAIDGVFTTLPSLHYQINGCALGSIDCVLLSPVNVPVVNPVPDFTIATSAPSDSEDDLLPNVAVEDF